MISKRFSRSSRQREIRCQIRGCRQCRLRRSLIDPLARSCVVSQHLVVSRHSGYDDIGQIIDCCDCALILKYERTGGGLIDKNAVVGDGGIVYRFVNDLVL